MKFEWKFTKKIYGFWKDNLERNAKRISIAIGAFLVYGLVTIPFDPIWKGAIITLGSIIIMSIFGKNGNGQTKEEEIEENLNLIKSRD